MVFKYGTFSFADGECLVTFFGRQQRVNSRGIPQTNVYTMVVEGEIIASGQAAIDARARLITTALSLDGGSAVLLTDGGNETVYYLGAANAHYVRVSNMSFLQQDGKAHYATGLPFTFTIEAEYGALSDGLVSYEERVTIIGTGGPRRVWPELDNGPAIEQVTSTHSNVTVIQSGAAVGSLAYPVFPQPFYPNAIGGPEDYQTTRVSPRRDGQAFVDWPISWTYRMTLLSAGQIPPPTYF